MKSEEDGGRVSAAADNAREDPKLTENITHGQKMMPSVRMPTATWLLFHKFTAELPPVILLSLDHPDCVTHNRLLTI